MMTQQPREQLAHWLWVTSNCTHACMLLVSLHTVPRLRLLDLQVKNKMSKADFLRNNRGINDGGDLPQARAAGSTLPCACCTLLLGHFTLHAHIGVPIHSAIS